MFENKLKKKIAAGEAALGSWIAFSDPYAVEVMGQAGFEWLLIDTEHCPIETLALRNILVALHGYDVVPVVRLMANEQPYFKMALDLGAPAVIVPMIESTADAMRAVEYCRYPPVGRRGFGPTRASNYSKDLEEYLARANDYILLVAQIESVKAVQSAAEIMSVKGIDVVFIGRGDLSTSMGLPGQMKHPAVKAAVDTIIAAARQAAKPWGIVASTPEEFVDYVERGATLVTVGGDLGFLLTGSSEAASRTRKLLFERKVGSPA
jgi:2-keto-3-deoxy-L-rhamnonate aldolase RhmA